MLPIVIPESEKYDESKNEFISVKRQTIQLEHSLVSISKWESKWHKPFLGKDKTDEETLDYIRCMTITQNVDPNIYLFIEPNSIDDIVNYINDPMTATWFREEPKNKKQNTETITSELIYYWMISLNIPVEFQKWHLNRLLTLIRVINVNNEPPTKLSRQEIMARNKALNDKRKAEMNSRG